MSESLLIRPLTREDGATYQSLRLESLQMNPEAFLSTYEAEIKLTNDAFTDHLGWSYSPPLFGYYGIFVDDELAGYVQLSKNYLEKQQHTMSLNNLYIAVTHRRKGFAQRLVTYVLKRAQVLGKIERVFLSCTAQNKTAYQFYKKLGFQGYSVKVKAIKWNQQYDDEVEMVMALKDKA